MLGFFEKYQRFIFLIVTIMIIASFAMFGVFDAVSHTLASREREDRAIGKAVDGSKIMLSEVQTLSRFLATDIGDVLGGAQGMPNLCNDGVIRSDLLQTGLAEMIVSAYFDECKESLEGRLEKAKKYRGYEHAQTPVISVRSVWERFMPAIGEAVDALQRQEHVSLSTFSQLSSLYQMQMTCPPEFVRRVLSYDQNKASWIEKDPALQHVDLSLMGCHSIADWFGSDCMDLFSQFIINGARLAETKGYRVSLEEAKGDLLNNFQTSIARLSHVQGIASLSFTKHLHSIGLDEKSAVEAWRSVLLFRRYFQGIGGAVFLDSLPFRDFALFACETAEIQKYEFPKSLRLSTFQDLVEFQVYLKALGGEVTQIGLPTGTLSPNAIARQTPDLVQATYRMKISSVSLDEVALRVGVREILDWQLDASHWAELQKVFPFLVATERKEDRFEYLEKLSSQQRSKLDLYVRKVITKEHPEWIAQLLSRSQSLEKDVSVGAQWVSFPGIHDVVKFKSLLDIPLSNIEEYSEDEEVFYRFEDIEQISPAHILTFGEARELGVMTWIADRYIQAEYERIRGQHAAQFQVGTEWKLFSSVKEEVARIVLSDLLRSIGGENKPLAYYASHRLELPAKEALFDLQYGTDQGETSDPIVDQFRLVPVKSSVQRNPKDQWMKEQLEKVDVGGWSSIDVPADGNISFFYFENKKVSKEPILDQIVLGKETMGADAQRYAARNLLSLAKQKKSIAIIQRDKK